MNYWNDGYMIVRIHDDCPLIADMREELEWTLNVHPKFDEVSE